MNPPYVAPDAHDAAIRTPPGPSPELLHLRASTRIVRALSAARLQRAHTKSRTDALRTRVRSFLMFPLVTLMVAFALTSCHSSQPTTDNQFWDGSLSLEQRATIEDVQRTILPAFQEILANLSAAGAGQFSELEGPSLTGRATDRNTGKISAFEVSTAIAAGHAIPPEEARRITGDIVTPLGMTQFSDLTPDDDDTGEVSYNWFDPDNGGFVELTILPDGSMTVYYISGMRPTDGSTTQAEQWTDGAQSDASAQ